MQAISAIFVRDFAGKVCFGQDILCADCRFPGKTNPDTNR